MKNIWKTRKDRDGVSPVIATILMVAITVVLAAVLYVMVMDFQTPPDFGLGITFDQEDRTTMTISLSVVTAPQDAKVEGTSTTITHDGLPSPVNNATLYGLTGTPVAFSDCVFWSYSNGNNPDIIKLSSAENHYVVSKHNVS